MNEQTLRFASALIDMMDGLQEHDLPHITGLPDDRCKRIYQAYIEAMDAISIERTSTKGGLLYN